MLEKYFPILWLEVMSVFVFLLNSYGNHRSSEVWLYIPFLTLFLLLFQGKFPLSGMTVNPLEDSEQYTHSFEITGKLLFLM